MTYIIEKLYGRYYSIAVLALDSDLFILMGTYGNVHRIILLAKLFYGDILTYFVLYLTSTPVERIASKSSCSLSLGKR